MKKNRNENYTWATFTSVVLHVALIGALLWGADMTRVAQTPAGKTIDAVFVDPAAVREQAKKIRQQRENVKKQEQKRIQRLENQAKRLEEERAREEKRLRDLKTQRRLAEKATREAEIERKRLDAAKQKARDEKNKAEKSARLAKKKAEEAESKRQKTLADKKRAEEKAEKDRERKRAQKVKDEAATRKKAEQKAAAQLKVQQDQEAALNEIFTGLASENVSRASARENLTNDEAKQWAGKFETMIQQNWRVDASMDNQTCRLKLRLAPDGLVIDVSMLSGNADLCRSASASVLKVNKFPMPSDPDVVAKLRNLNLNFER